MNRLVFLGTGGDSALVGKQARGSGGIIAIFDDFQIHIDPGPGALVRAAHNGISLRNNDCILVSHAHTNHCSDLNPVIAAMTYNGLDPKGVLISNSNVIEGNEQYPPMLHPFHNAQLERTISLIPAQKVGIENIEIHAIPAFHSESKALGFKLISPQLTVTYSGDTSYKKELIPFYKGSDILILNTVFQKSEHGDQLSIEDAHKIIEFAEPELTIITHFGYKLSEPLQAARELSKATGRQVIAAEEGLMIDPKVHSARIRQRTLNLY